MNTESDQPTNQSLFALVQSGRVLEDKILEAGGELPPELEAELAKLETALPAKVEAYSVMMSRWELEEEYWAHRAEQLERIAKGFKAARERLKEALKVAMATGNLEKIEGETVFFSLSKGKEVVEILNAGEVPEDYKSSVVVVSVEKDRVREDLLMGQEIPGVRLKPSYTLRSGVKKPEKKTKEKK